MGPKSTSERVEALEVPASAEVAAAEVAPELDPCDSCLSRFPATDERVGYCDVCTRRERKCAGCGEYRSQGGWGWGFHQHGPLVKWVCARCKFADPLDAAADHPRFSCRLDPDERGRIIVGTGPQWVRVGKSPLYKWADVEQWLRDRRA